MDGTQPSIAPLDLYARLGTAAAPTIADVRVGADFAGAGNLIASAVRRPPDEIERRRPAPAAGRRVVVYCVHGHDVSRSAAAALRAAGIDAAPGRWVTRARPKIDRIACPWLIRRFIDPDAEFIYVPRDRVLAVAKESGATPYDIDGVAFAHVGERCSFDAILRAYDIRDPALDLLADIVRGADTSRHDLTAQCGGLVAVSHGLSANFADDHEMLGHGMVIYDALYTWCRGERGEARVGRPSAGAVNP